MAISYTQTDLDNEGSNDATALPQINDLVDITQNSLKQAKNALAEVEKLSEQVKSQTAIIKRQNRDIQKQNEDIKDQKDTIRAIQAIVVLGFVLALITLVGVVVTDWSFMQTSTKQITEQTTLLQSIGDKVNSR